MRHINKNAVDYFTEWNYLALNLSIPTTRIFYLTISLPFFRYRPSL